MVCKKDILVNFLDVQTERHGMEGKYGARRIRSRRIVETGRGSHCEGSNDLGMLVRLGAQGRYIPR